MCYMKCTRSKCAEVLRCLYVLHELYKRQVYLVPSTERVQLLLTSVPCVTELHGCTGTCVWFVH